jgi:hypothetical protein
MKQRGIASGDLCFIAGATTMSDSVRQWALVAGFVAVWFVLNKWVLPKLGFRT